MTADELIRPLDWMRLVEAIAERKREHEAIAQEAAAVRSREGAESQRLTDIIAPVVEGWSFNGWTFKVWQSGAARWPNGCASVVVRARKVSLDPDTFYEVDGLIIYIEDDGSDQPIRYIDGREYDDYGILAVVSRFVRKYWPLP